MAIHPEEDAADRRPLIAKAIQNAGGIVRELRTEAPSLEQLFLRLVTGEADVETSAETGEGGDG